MSVENSLTSEESIACVQVAGIHRPKVRIGPRTDGEQQTEVRLVKNKGVIETIRIVCACGEEININCVYPDSK